VSTRDPASKINLQDIPGPIFFMYGLKFANLGELNLKKSQNNSSWKSLDIQVTVFLLIDAPGANAFLK
jgi:hypothetical protein